MLRYSGVFPYEISFYGTGAFQCKALVVGCIPFGRGECPDAYGVYPLCPVSVRKQFVQGSQCLLVVPVAIVYYGTVEAEMQHQFCFSLGNGTKSIFVFFIRFL